MNQLGSTKRPKTEEQATVHHIQDIQPVALSKLADLPEDLLLFIFSTWLRGGLIGPSLFVCHKWRRIALKSIEWLDLSYPASLLDESLGLAACCPRLRAVRLEGLQLQPIAFFHLSQAASTLEELKLRSTGLLDGPLRALIRRCSRLTMLSISTAPQLSWRALSGLENASDCLTHLSLPSCSAVDNAAAEQVFSRCPKLRHLDISGTMITGGCFSVFASLTNLKSLNLSSLNLTSTDTAPEGSLWRYLTQLTSLNLERAILTGSALQDLTILTCLRHLDISWTGFTDEITRIVSPSWGALESLSAAGNELSNAAVIYIVSRAHALKELLLTMTRVDDGIFDIVRLHGARTLKQLYLSDTRVTLASVEQFIVQRAGIIVHFGYKRYFAQNTTNM